MRDDELQKYVVSRLIRTDYFIGNYEVGDRMPTRGYSPVGIMSIADLAWLAETIGSWNIILNAILGRSFSISDYADWGSVPAIWHPIVGGYNHFGTINSGFGIEGMLRRNRAFDDNRGFLFFMDVDDVDLTEPIRYSRSPFFRYDNLELLDSLFGLDNVVALEDHPNFDELKGEGEELDFKDSVNAFVDSMKFSRRPSAYADPDDIVMLNSPVKFRYNLISMFRSIVVDRTVFDYKYMPNDNVLVFSGNVDETCSIYGESGFTDYTRSYEDNGLRLSAPEFARLYYKNFMDTQRMEVVYMSYSYNYDNRDTYLGYDREGMGKGSTVQNAVIDNDIEVDIDAFKSLPGKGVPGIEDVIFNDRFDVEIYAVIRYNDVEGLGCVVPSRWSKWTPGYHPYLPATLHSFGVADSERGIVGVRIPSRIDVENGKIVISRERIVEACRRIESKYRITKSHHRSSWTDEHDANVEFFMAEIIGFKARITIKDSYFTCNEVKDKED